jgi:hypothetical protein
VSIRYILFLRSGISCMAFVYGVTGFRSIRRDMDMSHHTCASYTVTVHMEPEDDEFHNGTDQAARDGDISAFLKRFVVQE